MIFDLIIFSVVGLCVPVDYTEPYPEWEYDCDWQIHVVDDREQFETIYENTIIWHTDFDERIDKIDTLAGFTTKQVNQESFIYQKIFVYGPSIYDFTILGCNLLWHEILHAWGMVEEELPLCKTDPIFNNSIWN